jgi:hypothetical protein
MDYRVRFKDTFLADLELIVKGVALHNPQAALNLGVRLSNALKVSRFFQSVIQKSANAQASGDLSSRNTGRCFTGCNPNHEPWKCSVVGMAAGNPIQSCSLREGVGSQPALYGCPAIDV